MTDIHQTAADLDFIKQVVERREHVQRSPWWLGCMWGVIVLCGCVWNDVHPQTAWMYWSLAPMLGFVISSVRGGRRAFMLGEYDAETGRKMGLHFSTCFIGGMPILILAFAGKIDGYVMGQLMLLVSGIIYYLAGVHFERRWMLPGVVMMVGAAAISFIPHWGWTTFGVAIFLSMVISFRPTAANRSTATPAAA